MENAVDALKMAFAIFVFILAITVTFSVIAHAKSAGDTILKSSDRTNYYEQLSTNASSGYRTVSKAEVVSTLYKYYIESIGVIIKINGNEYVFYSGNESKNESGTIEKLNLTSETDKRTYLDKFVKEKLSGCSNFKEEFVEISRSGSYLRGDDGTEVIITPGTKEVYVTYTAQ